MALVNPNISLSVKPLEIPQRNALTEAVQVMNLQQAQMQMQKLQQTDEAIERIRQAAVKNGGPGDINEIAQAFLQSPDLGHQQLGLTIRQQQQEKTDFDKLLRTFYPELVGAAPSAVSAAPATNAMQPGALGSGTFDVNAPAPATNALAPAPVGANALAPVTPSTAPAAPVNALATSQEKTPDQLRREILLFGRSKDPGAKNVVSMLNAQLAEALKTTTVSPGQQVYRGGRVVYEREPTPSEFERLLKDSGLTEDQKTALRRQRATKEATHAPPVSVSMTQEKAESADYGKFLVEQFKNVTKASDLAQKSMPAIESNLAILDKGFDTGFATETMAAGAKVLAALGVKDADKYATDAQAFLSNASAAVLQKQLEQKGPQTESDAQRITQTGAQLGNTKAANQFVLNVAKAQLQRDIQQRNFYADWRKTHKTLEGAEDAWNAGPGSKSLFDAPALKKYAAPAPAVAAPTPENRPSLDSIFNPKK